MDDLPTAESPSRIILASIIPPGRPLIPLPRPPAPAFVPPTLLDDMRTPSFPP